MAVQRSKSGDDYAMFVLLGGRIIPRTRTVFTCKLCRQVQFDQLNLGSHAPQRHKISRRKLGKDLQAGGVATELCTSYFLSAPTLGFEQSSDLSVSDGKLLCCNCFARVGSFSWPGSQCSCGTWVVPAIQIPKSKVDAKVVAFELPLPESAMPRGEEEEPELEEDEEEGSGEENTPAAVKVERHQQLLEWMLEGNVQSIRECLGEASLCLMETVKGKNLEGADAVVAAYDRLISAHLPRLCVIQDAVLQQESGDVVTTCAMFGVLKSGGVESQEFSSKVQETIWWNLKQHSIVISRAKCG